MAAAFAAPAIGAGTTFLLNKLFGGKGGASGSAGGMETFPTMTEEQQQLLAQLLGGLGGPMQAGLGNLQQLLTGGPEAFEAYEKPLMRQFHEQIVPKIGERFTGGYDVPGAASAQGSSAFGQQLGAAGAGLSELLGQQRAGLQSQALDQLRQLLGIGIGAKPFQAFEMPGQEGGLQKLFGGIGASAGEFTQGGGFGRMGQGISSLFQKLFGSSGGQA